MGLRPERVRVVNIESFTGLWDIYYSVHLAFQSVVRYVDP
jgi:hypothetical protein